MIYDSSQERKDMTRYEKELEEFNEPSQEECLGYDDENRSDRRNTSKINNCVNRN